MVSVIIAAHNEESVIGACLDALAAQHVPGLQVIVSANGCHDRTAEVAAAHGATVVDRAEPGKAGALNAAERIATSFPRVYLDADIVVPAGGLQNVLDGLDETSGALAAVPRRRIESRGRTWPVRSYFAVNERLPAFRAGLFGRGMIAVSETGRGRFDGFPELIADDLFLDSLFEDAEKREVSDVEISVAAPMRTAELLARLARVRRGNGQMRAAAGELEVSVRPSDTWSWLRDVVLPHPHLAIAAVAYVTITAAAIVRARRSDGSWGQDASTRRAGDATRETTT